MLDLIPIILSLCALGVSIWSKKSSAKETRQLLRDTERRDALKTFTELIGGMGRHFVAVHGMVTVIKDPNNLERMMQGLVESYNQKEITENLSCLLYTSPSPRDRG